MKVYVWRHNKTYHSHSMINEPCVQSHFYLDALAIVAADSLEEALAKLEAQHAGWRIEDLRQLTPKVYALDEAQVIFTEVRGSIAE
ncbi:hypothetical protein [uncultured Phascolarctobacterium sp.]|uniref:hypothetical protein n=1 Tax=Phascolarctobacterium sp. TaxID=2049039 RepID=UPI0025D19C90|nr:hypothetical protein [uncultured Phascolarctobacterium sp.]